MGDVFHTFPALSDAQKAIPNLVVDWVVEKSFSEIPKWHPTVDKVYPIELRKWRKSLHKRSTRKEISSFFEEINQTKYDMILDAQGLLKSAWVARRVKGEVSGFDWKSAREGLASLFYKNKCSVLKDQHAISRLRQLFSKALNYPLDKGAPIFYGLDTSTWKKPLILQENIKEAPYMVFLHGTTWETKYWPEAYWIELLKRVQKQGYKVILPWGNTEEHSRALRIAGTAGKQATWVPSEMLSLNEMAKTLKNAQAVVSVDTGLSHVATALETPMVVLYRVTDPKLVGADGTKVLQLASPCAPDYIKRFSDAQQEAASLRGLSVDEVFHAALPFLK